MPTIILGHLGRRCSDGPSRGRSGRSNRTFALVGAVLVLAACSKAPTGMSQAEQAVVEELTLARTQPLEYAKFLERYREAFGPDGTALVGGKLLETYEGVQAVDEAIAFLRSVKPVSPMTGSLPLALAARDHVADTGAKGTLGHAGTDGSSFSERIARHGAVRRTSGENIFYGPGDARFIVMQLIIDDGVPGRGHRTNIYNPDFATVGVALGDHKGFAQMCVMDLADAVTGGKG